MATKKSTSSVRKTTKHPAAELATQILNIRTDLDSMTARMASAKAIFESIIMHNNDHEALADAGSVVMDAAVDEVAALLDRLLALAQKFEQEGAQA